MENRNFLFKSKRVRLCRKLDNSSKEKRNQIYHKKGFLKATKKSFSVVLQYDFPRNYIYFEVKICTLLNNSEKCTESGGSLGSDQPGNSN